MIVDAQSVKNTDSAEHKGYDAGKKVSGIKRPIAVDTQGLPHAIAITTVDVTDRKGALAAMDRCASNLQSVQSGWGLHGAPFCASRTEEASGGGTGGQTQRSAHLYRAAPALGRGTLLRLAGKMPSLMEELRAYAQYQVCSSSIWRSWHCCSGDCKQALRGNSPARRGPCQQRACKMQLRRWRTHWEVRASSASTIGKTVCGRTCARSGRNRAT
ncbi:putative transposase [Nitrococcus mobilis Nb-231]|uniref:Putative transposase n=1 Tax=Nitrococcus mobilis Nb-231 TaxID=314278 RepID=A4BNY8_9GAMM|nr:putative transposase [Nitrococcus mobilis Nb-231]